MALPDIETAITTLERGIEHEVFFSKLASAGLQPRTVEEARAMLDTSDLLEQHATAEREKAAADGRSLGHQLKAALEQELGRSHRPSDLAVEKAAADYVRNPAIYNAVLALRAAELAAQPAA